MTAVHRLNRDPTEMARVEWIGDARLPLPS